MKNERLTLISQALERAGYTYIGEDLGMVFYRDMNGNVYGRTDFPLVLTGMGAVWK